MIGLVYAHHEYWKSYLDQKDHYMGHFGEMLNRKNDQYHTKREVWRKHPLSACVSDYILSWF